MAGIVIELLDQGIVCFDFSHQFQCKPLHKYPVCVKWGFSCLAHEGVEIISVAGLRASSAVKIHMNCAAHQH